LGASNRKEFVEHFRDQGFHSDFFKQRAMRRGFENYA
jgi:hypothetical protein